MKNTFQSDSKLEYVVELPESRGMGHAVSRPIELPKVEQVNTSSLGSTQSELRSILSDRKTFVSKYFE